MVSLLQNLKVYKSYIFSIYIHKYFASKMIKSHNLLVPLKLNSFFLEKLKMS